MTPSRPARLYILAAVLIVAAVPALWVDAAVGRWAKTDQLPGDVRKLVALSEAFAHGMGVAVILAAVLVLDPERRRAVPVVALCAFGGGLVAQTVKILFPRWRPGMIDDIGGSPAALATFQGWTAVADPAVWFHRDGHSFPSGHTATAAGLAVGLSWLYPRGRWLFAALAGLAAVQRVDAGAHYVSDVLAGAACGIFFAAMVLDTSRAVTAGAGAGRRQALSENKDRSRSDTSIIHPPSGTEGGSETSA